MKLNKRIALLAATTAAAVATTASAQWQLTGNTGTNTLGSTNSADFVFKTNNTTRGVVTAGGNVGIGTTSPAKLLHVNQSGSPQVRLSDPTANVFWDIWAGSNFLISRVTSGVSADWIKFDDVNHGVRIGPSAQFFISLAAGSVGRVGIGTTSPSDMLEVAGEITPAADCSGNNIGGDVGRWNTIYARNGTIQTSDARMKENIADINYGLDAVMKLRPVSFTWKNDPAYGTKLGLIAQELRKVIPEVVKGDEDGGMMGVFYSDLIPVVIKAVQEQQGETVERAGEHRAISATSEGLDARLARLEKLVNEGSAAGVESSDIAGAARLDQNDPNPTGEMTSISYFIPNSAAKAELVISEIGSGKVTERIALTGRGSGEISVRVKEYRNGTYIYSMVVDGRTVASRKMVVAK